MSSTLLSVRYGSAQSPTELVLQLSPAVSTLWLRRRVEKNEEGSEEKGKGKGGSSRVRDHVYIQN